MGGRSSASSRGGTTVYLLLPLRTPGANLLEVGNREWTVICKPAFEQIALRTEPLIQFVSPSRRFVDFLNYQLHLGLRPN